MSSKIFRRQAYRTSSPSRSPLPGKPHPKSRMPTDDLSRRIRTHIRSGAYPHVAAINEATAIARARAEIEVFRSDPKQWLKHGPGKETGDDPGWTTTVKPKITESNQQINILLHPEMQGLFAAILQILAPYPEARAQVAQALAGESPPSSSSSSDRFYNQ